MANTQTIHSNSYTLGQGELMAWDATVPDTSMESHLSCTAAERGAAAKQAADKTAKYQGLEKTHNLFPVAT